MPISIARPRALSAPSGSAGRPRAESTSCEPSGHVPGQFGDGSEAARVVQEVQVVEDQNRSLVHRREGCRDARQHGRTRSKRRRRQCLEHARVELRYAVERGRDVRQQDDRVVVVLVDGHPCERSPDRARHCANSVVFPQPGPADIETTGAVSDSSSKSTSAVRGTAAARRRGARSFDSNNSSRGAGGPRWWRWARDATPTGVVRSSDTEARPPGEQSVLGGRVRRARPGRRSDHHYLEDPRSRQGCRHVGLQAYRPPVERAWIARRRAPPIDSCDRGDDAGGLARFDRCETNPPHALHRPAICVSAGRGRPTWRLPTTPAMDRATPPVSSADQACVGSEPAPRAVHLTVAERAALGKAARGIAPRAVHGDWEPATDRRDPVALLEEQAASRVPALVPLRYGRMLVSPFTFFRGAAYPMAADLADAPRTGLDVQLCGDAHLSNFGGFAAPDRRLVFSINDFDETLPGPFEWDVKRLAASLAVAGRDRGFDAKQRQAIDQAVTRSYREAMRTFAGMPNLDLWYARIDVDEIAQLAARHGTSKQQKRFERNLAKAQSKDSMKAFSKLTEIVDGQPEDCERSTAHRPDRRAGLRCRTGPDREVRARRAPRLPAHADRRPPGAARSLSLRAFGSQGRRRGQRRHARLDPADARPRRERSALPSAQGGGGLGAGAVPGSERVRQPRPAGRRGPASDPGRRRHPARLDCASRTPVAYAGTSTSASSGMAKARR